MGETAIQTPQVAIDLPSAEASFSLPLPYQLWMSVAAKRAGLVLALTPVAVFVTIFLMIVSFEAAPCGYGDTCEVFIGSFWFMVFYAIGLVALLSFATLLARIGMRALHRDSQARFYPRLQSYKDWYVRGDITEGEFEQLRAIVEPAVEGKTPGTDAQRAVRVLKTFSIILSAIALILLPVNFVIMIESLDESGMFPLVLILLIVDTVTLWLLASGWMTVGRASKATKNLDEQVLKRVDALESEILRTAHSRRRSPGSGSGAFGSGPSFRAYGGR